MAVVLAAGKSERFGSPKALMAVRGATALEAVALAARDSGASEIVVVTGYDREAVAPFVARASAREVANPSPERGMMSSVRAGLGIVPPGHAALVWPVDHPFVSPSTVRRMLASLATDRGRLGGRAPIVVPTWDGRGGHPLLVPPDLVPVAAGMDDAGGLDRLLSGQRDRVLRLPVDDPGVVADINRPDDLAGR